MRTTILAYVITVLGLAMIGGGAWGLIDLWQHQSAQVHVPLRYYGMAIGMICGGFGMGGIAQGLMLVAIARETQGLQTLAATARELLRDKLCSSHNLRGQGQQAGVQFLDRPGRREVAGFSGQ